MYFLWNFHVYIFCFDMMVGESRGLVNIPRYHYLVPEWMKTASDAEKRGVIKLARLVARRFEGSKED